MENQPVDTEEEEEEGEAEEGGEQAREEGPTLGITDAAFPPAPPRSQPTAFAPRMASLLRRAAVPPRDPCGTNGSAMIKAERVLAFVFALLSSATRLDSAADPADAGAAAPVASRVASTFTCDDGAHSLAPHARHNNDAEQQQPPPPARAPPLEALFQVSGAKQPPIDQYTHGTQVVVAAAVLAVSPFARAAARGEYRVHMRGGGSGSCGGSCGGARCGADLVVTLRGCGEQAYPHPSRYERCAADRRPWGPPAFPPHPPHGIVPPSCGGADVEAFAVRLPEMVLSLCGGGVGKADGGKKAGSGGGGGAFFAGRLTVECAVTGAVARLRVSRDGRVRGAIDVGGVCSRRVAGSLRSTVTSSPAAGGAGDARVVFAAAGAAAGGEGLALCDGRALLAAIARPSLAALPWLWAAVGDALRGAMQGEASGDGPEAPPPGEVALAAALRARGRAGGGGFRATWLLLSLPTTSEPVQLDRPHARRGRGGGGDGGGGTA